MVSIWLLRAPMWMAWDSIMDWPKVPALAAASAIYSQCDAAPVGQAPLHHIHMSPLDMKRHKFWKCDLLITFKCIRPTCTIKHYYYFLTLIYFWVNYSVCQLGHSCDQGIRVHSGLTNGPRGHNDKSCCSNSSCWCDLLCAPSAPFIHCISEGQVLWLMKVICHSLGWVTTLQSYGDHNHTTARDMFVPPACLFFSGSMTLFSSFSLVWTPCWIR